MKKYIYQFKLYVLSLKFRIKRLFIKDATIAKNKAIDLLLTKELYELVKEWGIMEYPGLHVYDNSSLSEMSVDMWYGYTKGYCFHVFYDAEFEETENEIYGFWADFEGFKKGLTVQNAINLVKKARGLN